MSSPPVGDVLGAPALVLEVVGMLPHVQAQDWNAAGIHQRVVLQLSLPSVQYLKVADKTTNADQFLEASFQDNEENTAH